MKKPIIALWFIGLVFSIVLSWGCKTTSKSQNSRDTKKTERAEKGSIFDNITKSTDLSSLVKNMSGTYVTSAQNMVDSSFYEIVLHSVPIWSSKVDKYLYVEQAIVGQENNPIKQQIYQLKKDNNGGFEIVRYNLSDNNLFKGKWNDLSFFNQYDKELLVEEVGCTLYVKQHGDGSYSGSTRMDHCINNDKGAAYATTILKVREGQIMSWEQGFNADKEQVWGAEKGGYRFVRK